MIDRLRLLAALQAVQPQITEAAVAELVPLFTRQSHPRGAPLLQPGQVWSAATVIESGLVRMHFLRRDGREFNKNFFSEGSLICPLTPAMWAEPSLFGISCIEPTQIWRCDCARFREVLDRHGHWEPLQRELLTRLLTGKLQREHDLLALSGRQRYESFCRLFPALSNRIPLLHLATYIGLTDVSLSRLRREIRGEADDSGPDIAL